jgi:hypothetical protein
MSFLNFMRQHTDRPNLNPEQEYKLSKELNANKE